MLPLFDQFDVASRAILGRLTDAPVIVIFSRDVPVNRTDVARGEATRIETLGHDGYWPVRAAGGSTLAPVAVRRAEVHDFFALVTPDRTVGLLDLGYDVAPAVGQVDRSGMAIRVVAEKVAPADQLL